MLKSSKSTLIQRQKHPSIADLFERRTVEIYEEGTVDDGLADEKRIWEAAATTRRLTFRADSRPSSTQRKGYQLCMFMGRAGWQGRNGFG